MVTGNRREKDIAALDQLFEATRTYRMGPVYLDLFKFLVRMARLSPYNGFLLHMQHPGATFVATPRQWERWSGRTVHPFARALVILQPGGPVAFVYDVADTDGPELPSDFTDPFGTRGYFDPKRLQKTVLNCTRDLVRVVEVDMGNSAAGILMPALRVDRVTVGDSERAARYRVQIGRHLDSGAKYAALCHELAHLYLGHLGAPPEEWWPDRKGHGKTEREFEAESVAWLITERCGLENPSAAYLSGYLKDNEQVPEISFDLVLRVAGYIEEMGKRKLKPRKAAQ